ncbi:hypothetical protein [Ectopseudomonas mendocina]|uniref:Uncharacterized protein n=1 Tax=Ectopseudomonas mendocina TaxID=300 RepID=A0A2R3QWM2_ECTME|nr:hypothetical protein [Pseudomonas mendocina]AVO56157.1 hypothetical protein C7A17_26580 [Pseudomonas mendocina]
MPYAADGWIGQDPIPGGIEISEQQYQEGLAGMRDGLHVQIINGEFFVGPLPVPEPEQPPDPTFKDSAARLNAEYQADIAALNQAFGTAAMAGGATQAAKQAAITNQYNARKAQYQTDYAALRAQYGV